MSEMVLRMPRGYVEVDKDEMEYVDGGHWDDGCYGNLYWWGGAIELSSHGAGDLAAQLAMGAAVGAIAVAIAPLLGATATATAVVGLAAGIVALGSGYLWYASNHKGVYLEYNYATGFKSIIRY